MTNIARACLALSGILSLLPVYAHDGDGRGGGGDGDGDHNGQNLLPVFADNEAQNPTNMLTGFQQTNLVSDVSGTARQQDSLLVNPWGLYVSQGMIVAADNHAGVATVYNQNGIPSPLIITIPTPPGGNSPAAPTGLVPNATRSFVITNSHRARPSLFIFVTEDGTISGWNPAVNRTNAVLMVDNSAMGAVYKGATLGWAKGKPYLFAANFTGGMVEVYDGKFHLVSSFTDTNVPADFGPFGIRNIMGQIFVTFAKHKPSPDQGDDLAGAGNGFVDIFDTTGKLLQQFAAHGPLNSPWGLTLAPGDFGEFSNALLVGNFGDGHINAFDLQTGDLLGAVSDGMGNPLVIDGLWSLSFGSREGHDGNRNADLFFTAGPNEEKNGLLGVISSLANQAAELSHSHGHGRH